jgi:hypothetical protein
MPATASVRSEGKGRQGFILNGCRFTPYVMEMNGIEPSASAAGDRAYLRSLADLAIVVVPEIVAAASGAVATAVTVLPPNVHGRKEAASGSERRCRCDCGIRLRGCLL